MTSDETLKTRPASNGTSMETLDPEPSDLAEKPGENPESPGFPWIAIAGLIACALILAAVLAIAPKYAAGTPQNAETAAVAGAIENPFADLTLFAKSAVVVDVKSGKTLFALNPDAQLPLASLTKVPLVLVVSEVLPLDTFLTIPRNIVGTGGVEPLLAGERWQVKDIIDFTLVTSSNDGAEILAKAANEPVRSRFTSAPEDNQTLWRMNELARERGLTQTYFLNVSGLDISTTLSGAYGSARDMATLFSYASKSDTTAFSGTARGDVLLTSENGAYKTVARNTNEAEAEIAGLILGKTGFTDLAGGNIAVVFDVGVAQPIVAVILGSTYDGRFEDIRKLVEATRAAIASE